MKALSLFTGAGGADLGLEAAGIEVVAMCENAPHARAVLRGAQPDHREVHHAALGHDGDVRGGVGTSCRAATVAQETFTRGPRMKKEPALTAYEERILRMTIDNPQVFDVPVRTVKRLLALIDALRPDAPASLTMPPVIECLEPARDHGPWRTITLVTAEEEPPMSARYCAACGMIHSTQDGQPDRWRPSSFHLPDERRFTAEQVRYYDLRNVVYTHLGTDVPTEVAAWIAEARALTRPVTLVPSLAFVTHPTDPGLFVMRIAEDFDGGGFSQLPVTRDHAARFFRAMPDRTFMVPAVKQPSGAHGHVPRVGSEIADMLERGELP